MLDGMEEQRCTETGEFALLDWTIGRRLALKA